MKNSYKLIGLFWDGKSIPNRKPNVYYEQNYDPNKMIKLSDILGLKDEDIESTIASNIFKYLYIDYCPEIPYAILSNFYSKRLLQIANYLDLEITCDSEASKEKVLDMIEIHYISAAE